MGRPRIQCQAYGSSSSLTHISKKEKRTEDSKTQDVSYAGPNQSAGQQDPRTLCTFPRSKTPEMRRAVVHLIPGLFSFKLIIFLQVEHFLPAAASPRSSLHKPGSNYSYLHHAATLRCHLSVRAPFVFGRENKEEGEGRKQEDLCIDQKCLGRKGGGRKREREMEID